ncbi:MAG: DUF4336 domain-containing protein [Myxococcota bacterium]
MLTRHNDRLWSFAIPFKFMGLLAFGTRMTVVRLTSGELWIHSPVPIDADLKQAIDDLGPVRWIVAPNYFHHLFVGDAVSAWPDAEVVAVPKLRKKRKDLKIHHDLVGGHQPWGDELLGIALDGAIQQEVDFFDQPSRTLICSDLMQNMLTVDDWFTRAYLKWSEIYGKPGLSKAVRLGFRDKPAARGSVDAMLEQDFDAAIMCHGEPITRDAKDALRQSYEWL